MTQSIKIAIIRHQKDIKIFTVKGDNPADQHTHLVENGSNITNFV